VSFKKTAFLRIYVIGCLKGKDDFKEDRRGADRIIASQAADRKQIINELLIMVHCIVLMAEDGPLLM
jgi:hypothetical protein